MCVACEQEDLWPQFDGTSTCGHYLDLWLNYSDNFVSRAQRETSHFFGFVYFRQVKDISVRRGYFQKVGSPVHSFSQQYMPECSWDSCQCFSLWCWYPGSRTLTCSSHCCRSLLLSFLRSWSHVLKQVMLLCHNNYGPDRSFHSDIFPCPNSV